MNVGAKVIVTAHWSSFRGMRGKVTQVTPHMMILIDDDRYPIRVGECEVSEVSEALTYTGAE